MEPILAQTSVTDYLDALPAYHHSRQTSELLDLHRQIVASENYLWRGMAFPPNGFDVVGALATYEDEISLPPGTYITGISRYFAKEGLLLNPGGFKFQIYDIGAKMSLFSRTFGHGADVAGVLQDLGGLGENMPRGIANVVGPLVVLEPGRLNLQVTNLSVDAQMIQVFLSLAVPKERRSVGMDEVKGVR
jgi:hypothetical protein